ncbi:hypothetical protein H310_01874 [Aphanomyces invadans]|uniref:Uncharacterized protein n=1 Tax=Aphanomyces invadans TaxID=157072 RepID=A0A024UMD0_9STRA|nr:hypothetical protein H310_01874 [Aphanomyces invadans]ETW07335.1 hypothetical protein H310_01874 [Aphanomyces invadans]|eukprot:XP_008863428.1 hypothetical protein H310_01874 [Aphanomyces invadans]
MVDICGAKDVGQCSPRKKLVQAQLKDRALREEDATAKDGGGGSAKCSIVDDVYDSDIGTPLLDQTSSIRASVLSANEQNHLPISLPNLCDPPPKLARQVSETYVRELLGEAQAKAATAREAQDACK